jgi:hypothetical protein
MRLRTSLRWLGVTAFVLGVAGSATAQPSGGAPAPAGQIGFERQANLSPKDQLSQVESGIARMEQLAGTVRRQLEQARAAHDVVKTLCLNDKLSQIDVAIRSARDRQQAHQAAVNRGDTEMANHEFTIVTVLQQRAVQTGAQANQCIGEEYAFVGQTEVTASVDPNLPGEDVTAFPPTDGTLISAPPVSISGSQ